MPIQFQVRMCCANGMSYDVGGLTESMDVAQRTARNFMRRRAKHGDQGRVNRLNPTEWELLDNGFSIGDYDGTLVIREVKPKTVKCFYCRDEVEVGEMCLCREPAEDYDQETTEDDDEDVR